MNKLLPKRTSAKTSFSVICDLLERLGPLPTIEIASKTGWEIKYTIETLAKVKKKNFIFIEIINGMFATMEVFWQRKTENISVKKERRCPLFKKFLKQLNFF